MKNEKEENKNDQTTEDVNGRETSHDQENECVGYKKPPRRTRFKPGQSGNPRGRPRKKESLHDRLSGVILKQIVVRRGGKKEKMTQLEALLHSQLLKATQGDTRAVQFCIKLAEQLGCLKHVFEGRELQPRDYLSRDEIDRMSEEDIEKLIEIYERADAKLNGGQ